MTPPPRIVVVGAGVGGLAAAHRLRVLAAERSRELEVVVLEAGSRAGGALGTDLHQGCRLERGPDSLVLHKPAGIELCRELGLAQRLADLPVGRVDVLHRGRLRPVPAGFALVAPTRRVPLLVSPLLGWRDKLRALAEPWVPASEETSDDESVASFVRRRFGAELLERIAGPVVGALFLADVEQLSMAATLPRFRALERQAGSVTAGLRGRPAGRRPGGVATLRDGLGDLADALVDRLPEGSLRLRASVDTVQRSGDGFAVRLADGRTLGAHSVLLATPAPAAARLVAGLDGALAERLRAIEFCSCATLHLAWPQRSIGRPLRSSGYFVPLRAPGPVVAGSFVHRKFPGRVPDGVAVVRLFLGGAGRPAALRETDDELVEQARQALAPLLGVHEPPAWSHLVRHRSSIPRLEVGHLDRVDAVRSHLAGHPGLDVTGGPLGAYGLPDTISAARSAAERLLDELDDPSRAG